MRNTAAPANHPQKRNGKALSSSPTPAPYSPKNRISSASPFPSASPQWAGQAQDNENASPNAVLDAPSVARFGSCGSVAEKADPDILAVPCDISVVTAEEPYTTIIHALTEALSVAKQALEASNPVEVGKMQATISSLQKVNAQQQVEIESLKKQNVALRQMLKSGGSGSPVKFRTLEEARAARRAVSFVVPSAASTDNSASALSTVPPKLRRSEHQSALTPLEQARAVRRSMRAD